MTARSAIRHQTMADAGDQTGQNKTLRPVDAGFSSSAHATLKYHSVTYRLEQPYSVIGIA